MRRLLVLSLLLVMLAALLAGCGGNGDSSNSNGVHHPKGGPIGAADEAACEANRRAIGAAVQQYYAIEGVYPTSIQQLVPKYLQNVPSCPAGGTYSLQGTKVVCSIHGS